MNGLATCGSPARWSLAFPAWLKQLLRLGGTKDLVSEEEVAEQWTGLKVNSPFLASQMLRLRCLL